MPICSGVCLTGSHLHNRASLQLTVGQAILGLWSFYFKDLLPGLYSCTTMLCVCVGGCFPPRLSCFLFLPLWALLKNSAFLLYFFIFYYNAILNGNTESHYISDEAIRVSAAWMVLIQDTTWWQTFAFHLAVYKDLPSVQNSLWVSQSLLEEGRRLQGQLCV